MSKGSSTPSIADGRRRGGLTTARRLAQILWNYSVVRRARVSYPPYRLWIEPTAVCNLRCPHCPNSVLARQERLGYMDFDLFRKVVDEASQWVHDVNLHHRGESMSHPRFFDMLAYAGERGLFTKLHTNATRLDQEKAEALLDSPLGLVSFSFDGFDKETYERHRVGAHFETTLENIVRFLRMKKARGQAAPYTVIEVMDFPDPGGAFGAEKRRAFEQRLAGLPLDQLVVKRPHNWAGSVDVGASMGSHRYAPCTFLWHSLVVMWDGKVGPCPHDFMGKIVLGDAGAADLAQIFHGQRLVALRNRMLSADVAGLDPCAGCDEIRRTTILGVPRESLAFLRW